MTLKNSISALVVAHNEQAQLKACLDTLVFCDHLVIVLDRCTDASADIARAYPNVTIVEGAWPTDKATHD